MTRPMSPDLETLEAALKRAAESHPGIAAAYLFGSVAAGRATPISDLDVALVFMPEVTEIERRQLGSEVASALVRDLGDVRPDVRDAEALPLAVRGEVATRGLRVASIDDVRRVRFEAETRQRYFDFLPFRAATVGPGLEALRARLSDGDAARLRDLLTRIESRVGRLESYGQRSEEEFTGDEEAAAAAKYFLLTAIEDALAVANHIIAAEGYRGPADYADAFRVLTEEGVLDRELGVRLEAMARFRNLLVHGYAEVDDQRVYGFLRTDLHDLTSYVRSVLERFPDLG